MSFRFRLVAPLAFGLLVGTSAASAQEAKPATAAFTFDAASLDAAIKGMQAFKAKFAEPSASQEQLTAAEGKISALRAQNPTTVDNYTSTHAGVSKCLAAFGASRNGDRTSQVQRKVMVVASDQNALEKFSLDFNRLSQELNAATAKKDSAEMQRINGDLNALLTLDAKGDSIAGAKKCGVLPAKPPVVVQIEEQQAIADSVRKPMEAAADSAGARAAAVAPPRFTQMRERLAQFLASNNGFAGKEGDVLKPRRSEIEALFKSP